MKTVNATVTQERLRQLADRVVRVVAEHKEVHVALAGPASAAVPAAEAYIAVYDKAVIARTAQRSDMEVGRVALSELWREIRLGLGAVQHARPAFDAGELTGSVESPEHLFSDGYKLIEVIGQGGLAEGDAIVELLKTALVKAEAEWTKAQTARVALQNTQAVVRQHAVVLNRELIALRRLLRTLLGTSHLAYQTLRTSRVMSPDVDDDDSVVEEIDPFAKTGEIAASNGATNNGAASNGASSNAVHTSAFATGPRA